MGEVGEVMADIFVMVSSSSRIFVQVGFKFLFHPTALNRNVINGMTSSLSSTASKQPSRVVEPDASDLPEEAGNGVDHDHDEDHGNSHRSNGTMEKGKDGTKNGTQHRMNSDIG